jgi:hypothetical protein
VRRRLGGGGGQEITALKVAHAETLRMHEQAAQAERDRHAAQLTQELTLLRTEHAQQVMARDEASAAQVSKLAASVILLPACQSAQGERARSC